MLWETQLMAKDQSKPIKEKEYKSKLQVLFLENPSTSLCKPVWRPSMVSSPLAEVNDNWLLVTDRLVRPLLPLTPLLTKKPTSNPETPQNNFSVCMLLLVKKDLLLPTLSRPLKITTLWDTPLWSLPLPLKLPHFSSWLLILAVLLENISETMENTLWSSMTICLNKPSPIVKCPFFLEDLQEERPTPVMCFIYTLVFSKELLKWTKLSVEDPWLPCPSLKPKLVMCPHIFQPTSSPLPMVKFSWRLSCSIKVSDLPSTSVCPSAESDPLLKSRPWSKLLVS